MIEQQHDPELERAIQSVRDLKHAKEARDDLERQFNEYRTDADGRIKQLDGQIVLQSQHIQVLDKENEGLRAQLKRANASRDHFMRAHSALKSYLLTLSPSIKQAIDMAESHSYGEKAPVPEEPEPIAMPSIVRRGPMKPSERADTLRVLTSALSN